MTDFSVSSSTQHRWFLLETNFSQSGASEVTRCESVSKKENYENIFKKLLNYASHGDSHHFPFQRETEKHSWLQNYLQDCVFLRSLPEM